MHSVGIKVDDADPIKLGNDHNTMMEDPLTRNPDDEMVSHAEDAVCNTVTHCIQNPTPVNWSFLVRRRKVNVEKVDDLLSASMAFSILRIGEGRNKRTYSRCVLGLLVAGALARR